MCNLYSLPTNQAAIIAFVRAMREIIGNMPVYPGIFLDYLAPIVRNAPYGVRELCAARWGLPSLRMEPDSGTHEYPRCRTSVIERHSASQ